MKLIVGLGNPGSKYASTRHNAGFLVLDALAATLGEAWSERREAQAEIIETNIDGEKVVLAKPQTFMNNSGESVVSLAQTFHIEPHDIWVVHDEAAIPFGVLRVRSGGSAGGHNGIKSIIAHLGGENFMRLRIGIGEAPEQMALEDWVLAHFSEDEWKRMETIVQKISEKILEAIKNNLTIETVELDD